MPQRAQAAASCRFRHREHTPPCPDRVNGRPVRPQAAQEGGVNTVDPRQISSVTKRPAAGGAPLVSTSLACPPASATARLRSTAG
jgi:hypothetical protein